MYMTTPGLVLRVCPYNESDAMLTILTFKQGKISAKARGLRRKNSQLSAPCQLLSYSEFTLFDYKDSYTVNEATSLELFMPLRRDLQKLSLGTYFAQVAEVICQEDMPNPELLSLVLNCLYALAKLNISENMVKAVFELRCACLAGYEPDLSACHRCGNQLPDRFDISEGHLECSGCRYPGVGGIRLPVDPSVLDAMRYICACDPKRLFAFQTGEQALESLAQISESYLTTQLEKGFATLDFYKSLQNPMDYFQ